MSGSSRTLEFEKTTGLIKLLKLLKLKVRLLKGMTPFRSVGLAQSVVLLLGETYVQLTRHLCGNLQEMRKANVSV